MTLYYTFHTKAALLGETIGAAIVGFDEWREPVWPVEVGELLSMSPWWADFQGGDQRRRGARRVRHPRCSHPSSASAR
jgi:hypothetical protein